jgi:hypothetical protein
MMNVDVKNITAALLANEWVTVQKGTFDIGDNVWYQSEGRQFPVAIGLKVPVTASWKTEKNDMITCPLTSILAVKW